MVFSVTEQLSITLQSSNIFAATPYFHRLRSDSTFDSFYKSVVEVGKALTDKPALP